MACNRHITQSPNFTEFFTTWKPHLALEFITKVLVGIKAEMGISDLVTQRRQK